MKILRLSEFFNGNPQDGYYAIWKSGKVYLDGDYVHGFSGSVVRYTYQNGFNDYPDWMDETDESEINIILLDELPTVDELRY